MPGIFLKPSFLVALLTVGWSIPGLATHADSDRVAPSIATRHHEIREIAFRGDHSQASSQALELLAEVEISHGPSSPETARALTLLADIYVWDRDRDPRVGEWIDRALAILEPLVGREHPDTAYVLAVRGFYRWLFQADTAGALSDVEESLSIRERTLPPDHPDLGESLAWVALSAALSGEFEPALKMFDRAERILADGTGDRLAIYWLNENHRAMALQNAGLLEEARAAYAKLVTGSRDALGERHRVHAESVVDQAQFFWSVDEYDKALAEYARGIELTARVLGPQHVRVLWFRAQHAGLLADVGELARAQRIFDEIWSPLAEKAGPQNPLLADVQGELISVHRGLGDLEQARAAAEAFVENADRMLDPVFGATGRIGLADILLEMGEPAEAVRLVELGLESLRRVAPEDQASQAFGSWVLARGLWRTGKPKRSVRLLTRALEIWERELGPDALPAADVLRSIAEVRSAEGDVEASLSALQRVVTIEREKLGPDHPRLGMSLAELARANVRAGRREQAWGLALEAEAITRRHLRLTAGAVSTRQALLYAGTRSRIRDLVLALALDRPASRAAVAWDRLVRSRGTALEQVALRAQLHAAALRKEPARFAALFAESQESAAALANLALAPRTDNDESHRTRVDAARHRTEAAERRLSAAAGRGARGLEPVDADRVRSSIRDDQVLISYVRYHEPAASRDGAARYAAFVISPAKAEPTLLRLGSAREIDALVSEWRESVEPETPFAEDEPAYREVSARLRNRIWDPLAEAIGQASEVHVVPDGALHAVSFAALPGRQGGYLVEDDRIWHYLSGERDLARAGADGESGGGLLAIGGVDFDRTTGPVAVAGSPEGTVETRLFRDAVPTCGEFRGLSFRPLPGSSTEVEEVVSAWADRAGDHDSRVLSAAGATEEEFKARAPGQRVLHVATHGYFLPADCSSGTSASDNPLLRSGLALAGANDPWSEGGRTENGVLTALEIASMNLSDVELVVLSACDTATGVIHDAEGVLGLRRAFEIAGADSVVSSLWRIDDEDAMQWMRPFYRGFLADGLPVPAAVAEASRAVLRDRRERGVSTHPVHWAAFVAD